MININNRNDMNYIDYIYNRDFNLMKDNIFNSYLNKSININYNRILRFATEDITTYMKYINDFDSYLTVCGSSDQIINSILYNSKNIDTFDINYFAKYGLILKLGAIKSLNKFEFLSFYSKFDDNLFFKILKGLNEIDRLFWINLYNYLGSILMNNLFYNNYLSIKNIININPYLQNNNYEIVKDLIDSVDINFIDSDLYYIEQFILNKKYNVINLSNIYDFINYDKFVSISNAYKYIEFIKKLFNYLKYNGSLLFSYIYKFNKKLKDIINKYYRLNNYNVCEFVTYQNIAYYILYELIDFNYDEIRTKTLVFGSSNEKEDVALIYKKR